MKLKKPKFWDYKQPSYLSYFLLPLTFPLIINNFLLNLKKKNKTNKNIKKICVGNIYIGGTAKTPLTVKIYHILKDLGFKTATVKKFYPSHTDEQKLLNEKTNLYCLRDRKKALNEAAVNNMDIAIFDDGLQDKLIDYDLEFVCFNNKKWIGNGLLIPAGPLREKIKSISKYDAIFLNGNKNDNTKLKLIIKKYDKNIPIFESFYEPTNINLFNVDEKYVIFSGIGNPDSFKETLVNNKLNVVKEIIFPDHYMYNQRDINKIKSYAKILDAKIITTEKDFIKINSNENNDIKFLKIELNILDEKKFINYLKANI